MIYRYCPHDPQRFATNLHRELGTPNLKWDNARGQDVLIIQTPFGVNAIKLIEELCGPLGQKELFPDRYAEIRPGVWARYVSAADKARMGGCHLHTEACTYTVFACYTDGETCSIYAPQNQAMISAHCDIPMEIHVTVAEQTRTEGWIRKHQVPTGFYTMTFPAGIAAGYHDGDLVYRIGSMTIPITRKMLEQGIVYIKTAQRPELLSRNKGLKLT